jgi:hydrogenase-1 operon protein HyaF
MSSLDDISITTIDPDDGNGVLRENVRAILHEIEGMLDTLLQTGETGAIDIRSLPLLPGDYDALESALGMGEVSAEFDGGNGPTIVAETGIPAVWWVSHYNEDEEIAAEFIEVTRVPEILLSQDDDMQDGLEALRTRLRNALRH